MSFGILHLRPGRCPAWSRASRLDITLSRTQHPPTHIPTAWPMRRDMMPSTQAGPGSGKTRVVVARVQHLVAERGVPPHRILAITFTNKVGARAVGVVLCVGGGTWSKGGDGGAKEGEEGKGAACGQLRSSCGYTNCGPG